MTTQTKDTLKQVRAALRESFSATAFCVRGVETTAGVGVHIEWTAGPERSAVDAVACPLVPRSWGSVFSYRGA
jgi:hypothetical protein